MFVLVSMISRVTLRNIKIYLSAVFSYIQDITKVRLDEQHTCAHAHTRARAHTHTHTHIYIYIYIYTPEE